MSEGELDTPADNPSLGEGLSRLRGIGGGLIVVGFFLLVGLRFWTSPVGREITGRSRNGLGEFLLIPLFLLIVGIGVVLVLWGPELR